MTSVDNENEIQPRLTLRQRGEAFAGALMTTLGSALYMYNVFIHPVKMTNPEKLSNPEMIGLGAVALVISGGLILADKLRQRFPPKEKPEDNPQIDQAYISAAITEVKLLSLLQKEDK